MLGLGPDGSDRLLTQLMRQGKVKRKAISFSLADRVFTLGGYDVDRFGQSGSKVEWFPIVSNSAGAQQEEPIELRDKKTSFQSNSHWMISMPAIKVDGE